MTKPYEISENIAEKVHHWITNQKGLLIWPNIQIGGTGSDRLTPACTAEGDPITRPPHWSCGAARRTITDPKEIVVQTSEEVCRFRVRVRRGSQGMSLKLTDTAQRRLYKALENYEGVTCTCGWSGFHKNLGEIPLLAGSTATAYACPKCKSGETLAFDPAWHVFDYSTQEAVILVCRRRTPLPEFVQKLGQSQERMEVFAE